MIHLLALLGVLSISFSAVFIRLAQVSPVTAVFYRGVYAMPLLAVLWLASRVRDDRSSRARVLAFVSGLLLAADLAAWHESIALVGAGLGTVIANVQVVFVAVLAWFLYNERPSGRTWLLLGGVLIGIALTSGLARRDAYGEAPIAGVLFGVLAGACYAVFLLVFRRASQAPGPRSGPLLESTIGMAVGALLTAPLDPRFSFVPAWPGHAWLMLLAIVAQVIGWLLIGHALAALPPLETSILLLVQPVFALIWGRLIFDERLSLFQWLGTGLILVGVATISMSGVRRREAAQSAA